MAEKVGNTVLKVDGLMVPVKVIRQSTGETGRKTAELMTDDPDAIHLYDAPRKIELELQAAVPKDAAQEPDWWNLTDAQVLVVTPDGQYRVSYEEFCTTEVTDEYSVGELAVRTIKGPARKPATGAQA